MSARIVFADGSKQLSHNNHDLRERWELRRDISAGLVRDESKFGYTVPVVDETTTFDQLGQLKGNYELMISAVNARMKHLVPEDRFWHERQHMRFVLAELRANQIHVKELLRAKRIEQANTEDRELFQCVKVYALELEDLLMAVGIQLPPPPIDRWNEIREWRDAKKVR